MPPRLSFTPHYALVAGLFVQLVWFSLSARESVFFKRKVEEAGAGLMRKNVQSVQSSYLCKGKAAKSRFAQALCLIALESTNALLRSEFVFGNNIALHLWKSCYPQAAREDSWVLFVKVEVRILFSAAAGN